MLACNQTTVRPDPGAGRHRRGVARSLVLGLAAALTLSGCGLFDDEDRLEGERIRIRPEARAAVTTAGAPISLPAPERNEAWTQTNGAPSHYLGHLAGPASLTRAWTANAGAGSGDDARITSRPIVFGGSVYTLDAEVTLSAFSADSGALRWRTRLAPEGERGREGFGGGLAAADGTIYATTGFGEVLAVDPASGEIRWRQKFGAPFRAGPAAVPGLIAAVTRDNLGLALEPTEGRVGWRIRGATATTGLLGGASPAISPPLVVLPFASGELVGVEGATGQRVWSAVLTGGGRGLARAAITDVSGDPVIIGPYVVAANQSGRMLALDGRNGQRLWTRNIGSGAPIWAAGETIFLVSDDSRLMALSLRDGSTLWATDLPAFRDPEDREDPIAYSGPVLVNGRLLLSDSLGKLIAFDATSGERVAETRLDAGSVTGPVVANGTVYVLSDNGRLQAFR